MHSAMLIITLGTVNRWNCRIWKFTTRTSETFWIQRRASWNSGKTRPGTGTSRWPGYRMSWSCPSMKWWGCCTRATGSGRWSRRAWTRRLPGATPCSVWRCPKRPGRRRPCAKAGCSWSTWQARRGQAIPKYGDFCSECDQVFFRREGCIWYLFFLKQIVSNDYLRIV